MYCNRCGTFDEKASLLNHRCSVKPAVKPEKIVSAPVKPDNVPKKKTWATRDPEAYKAYMREYMRKRRNGEGH